MTPGARPLISPLPGPGWSMGLWAQGPGWGPLPLMITFDGNPDRLALFQTIGHLDRYGHLYLSQWAIVGAVTAALQGEAVE